MSNSRVILFGALAVVVAVLMWVFLSDTTPAVSNPGGVGATGQPNGTLPGSSPGGKSKTPGTGRTVGRAEPAGERPSPFLRRQELERDGYHAAGEGVKGALLRLAGYTGPSDRAAFLRGMFARLGESGS